MFIVEHIRATFEVFMEENIFPRGSSYHKVALTLVEAANEKFSIDVGTTNLNCFQLLMQNPFRKREKMFLKKKVLKKQGKC